MFRRTYLSLSMIERNEPQTSHTRSFLFTSTPVLHIIRNKYVRHIIVSVGCCIICTQLNRQVQKYTREVIGTEYIGVELEYGTVYGRQRLWSEVRIRYSTNQCAPEAPSSALECDSNIIYRIIRSDSENVQSRVSCACKFQDMITYYYDKNRSIRTPIWPGSDKVGYTFKPWQISITAYQLLTRITSLSFCR